MTHDDEVKAMEIATKLVLGALSGVDTIAIKAAGHAIVAILDETEVEATIRAVGELLQTVTRGDREQAEKGNRWGRRSQLLSQEDARKVLRGLTLEQVSAFCDRWEYGCAEVMGWAMGHSDIHGGALWALGDREEMAKITGDTR